MKLYKVASVRFDLSFDLSCKDEFEEIDEDFMQKSLQNEYIGKVFLANEEEEVADAICDMSGWCLCSLGLEEVFAEEN
jgi:hypothetical protein